MQLSQDTLLAILAAVLIADVLVVFIALIWTQVQKRRSDAASRALPIAATAPRPVLSAAVGGAAGQEPLGVGAGRPAMPPPSDAATDGLTGLLARPPGRGPWPTRKRASVATTDPRPSC